MKIKELRLGNLIKVNPRENQEGLLAILEIQKETIIGEMIDPRPGYHFRIKFDEIIFIKLDEEWLEKLGFEKDKTNPYIWRDSRRLVDFSFSSQGKKLFVDKENPIGKRAVEYVNDFQNLYFFLTGEEISVGASESIESHRG